ncbi:MAG: isopentenyl-diphosphate delta-isomerase, partial [Thiotrichales bacterium]
MSDHAIVSFDEELLILVDGDDNVTGYQTKHSTHSGMGLLHRAFSVFVFARDGRLLLQQRSAGKQLWPLHWSNSCCSHPRKGESYVDAAHRRLREELGFDVDLEMIYKFGFPDPFLLLEPISGMGGGIIHVGWADEGSPTYEMGANANERGIRKSEIAGYFHRRSGGRWRYRRANSL